MTRGAPLPARVLLTGTAGRIGSCLREGLRPVVDTLVLTDIRPIEPVANERFTRADLADRDAMLRLAQDVDAIVHLGAIPTEAPFDDLVRPNLIGAFNIFEAARRSGVTRVVYASSNHATGFYPSAQTLTGDEPPRPDTLYGVTKVYGEALGRLYADKFGLEVVCVRIGTFAERPRELRELSTWLSPDDAVRLFVACLSGRSPGFRIVYGASANRRLFGYEPQDDGERYVDEVDADAGLYPVQGGPFAARDAGGWTG